MIAYTISWIAEEVDTTVGGIPDILMIRDGESPPRKGECIIEHLSENTIREIAGKVREDRKKLPELLSFSK